MSERQRKKMSTRKDFGLRRNATYKDHRGIAPGYLVYDPQLDVGNTHQNGSSWDLQCWRDGHLSLVPSRADANKSRKLVLNMICDDRLRIAIADFELKMSREQLPMDLSFADELDVSLIVNLDLALQPAAR